MKLLAPLQAAFVDWLRQPTTIHGIGALAALSAGEAVRVLTGDDSIAAAAGVVAYSAPHLLINDNTASAAVEQLLKAAIQARLGTARQPIEQASTAGSGK